MDLPVVFKGFGGNDLPIYDDICTITQSSSDAINIRVNLLLLDPNTLQPSRKITTFVFYDICEEFANNLMYSMDKKGIEDVVKNQLYMHISHLIDAGALYRVSGGIMVSRDWLFAEMIKNGHKQNHV